MNASRSTLLSRKPLFFSLVLAGALLLVACANDESIIGSDDDNGDNGAAQTATVEIAPTTAEGSNASGTITITHGGDSTLSMSGTISGLTPGAHGFHLHAEGSCEEADSDNDGAMEPAGAAGPHYNKQGVDSLHAGPADPPEERHFGDFGNITADDNGEASVDLTVDRPEGIDFENDVVGRALIVHEGEDDLQSDPGGNSGTRFGCGMVMSQ